MTSQSSMSTPVYLSDLISHIPPSLKTPGPQAHFLFLPGTKLSVSTGFLLLFPPRGFLPPFSQSGHSE